MKTHPSRQSRGMTRTYKLPEINNHKIGAMKYIFIIVFYLCNYGKQIYIYMYKLNHKCCNSRKTIRRSKIDGLHNLECIYWCGEFASPLRIFMKLCAANIIHKDFMNYKLRLQSVLLLFIKTSEIIFQRHTCDLKSFCSVNE